MCCVAGISGQYPLVQNVTVTEGGTANMTCRVEYNDNTSLQWSNPAQQTLFFGDKKGELKIDRQQRPQGGRWDFLFAVCLSLDQAALFVVSPFLLDFTAKAIYTLANRDLQTCLQNLKHEEISDDAWYDG